MQAHQHREPCCGGYFVVVGAREQHRRSSTRGRPPALVFQAGLKHTPSLTSGAPQPRPRPLQWPPPAQAARVTLNAPTPNNSQQRTTGRDERQPARAPLPPPLLPPPPPQLPRHATHPCPALPPSPRFPPLPRRPVALPCWDCEQAAKHPPSPPTHLVDLQALAPPVGHLVQERVCDPTARPREGLDGR